MPIQHAVLALLADGESHGYELREQFEQAVGPQWGDLSIGHLYQVLDRLAREGLVKRRGVRQAARPDRIVYRLTNAGRAELDAWIETPFVRQSGYRDDFFLKLAAAARLGPDPLQRVIATQRKAYTGELHALAELRAQHETDPVVRLLIEAAIDHTEANLRTVDRAAENAAELASAKTRERAEPASRGVASSG
jgi:DNA-binding PadR family transcriptional regulator